MHYLALAERFARGGDRSRHLIGLGDLLLARGERRRAFHAYAQALRTEPGDRGKARCEQRLARALLAPGHGRASMRLLEAALPCLSGKELLAARADLAVGRQLGGDRAGAEAALEAPGRPENVSDAAEATSVCLRARLRLGLLAEASDVAERGRRCAAALVFSGDVVEDLALLVETTLLLRAACPDRVDPTLYQEALRAARRIGNTTAEARLLAPTDPSWQPALAGL
ncbi:MAG: hypothetical protein ACYCST_18800 [Acidimicrobiales bacterium]